MSTVSLSLSSSFDGQLCDGDEFVDNSHTSGVREEGRAVNGLLPHFSRISEFLQTHGYPSVHLVSSDVDELTKYDAF